MMLLRTAARGARRGVREDARPAPHESYDDVARASAAVVIDAYSSSFGAASRLLAEPVRGHVRSIYALVRVADEVVDAPRPGGSPTHQAQLLDALEAETLSAMATGHSTNLVVHAFAQTARACRVEPALVTPFFRSMRADLEVREHDEASFRDYVFGSAEVVGLMCLRAFVVDERDHAERYAAAAPGAQRLGAAFQKVNFLRDLAEDADLLGRRYFPGIDPARLDDAQRDRLLDDVDADLAVAAGALPVLPPSSRVAVCAAHDLFAELSARLRETPAEVLRAQRVRVPSLVKARLVGGAVARRGRPRPPRAPRPVSTTGASA